MYKEIKGCLFQLAEAGSFDVKEELIDCDITVVIYNKK